MFIYAHFSYYQIRQGHHQRYPPSYISCSGTRNEAGTPIYLFLLHLGIDSDLVKETHKLLSSQFLKVIYNNSSNF